MTPCPVCEQSRFRPVVSIPQTTVNIGVFYADRDEALRATRGDIELAVCEGCGLVRNLAFQADRVVYDGQYENSQMFSGTFRAFAEELAASLVDRYGLRGGRAVEIGCGKGEFLELLCGAGVASGVGYDPTYEGEVDRCGAVRIERELYDTERRPEADLVLSRHVVEHLVDPLAMLRGLRRSLEGSRIPLYVEVPDARFVIAGEGLWDVIYPHVSYFSDLSMEALLRRAGFAPEGVEAVFARQFLAAHARPGEVSQQAPEPAALAAWIAQVEAFGERFRGLVARWTREIAERARHGPVVLWGAGAKGVAFMNFTAAADHVSVAVDVNPRKHGAHLPGTGHRIVPPAQLRELRPRTVLVMNALYEAEIRGDLRQLGLDAETVCV